MSRYTIVIESDHPDLEEIVQTCTTDIANGLDFEGITFGMVELRYPNGSADRWTLEPRTEHD